MRKCDNPGTLCTSVKSRTWKEQLESRNSDWMGSSVIPGRALLVQFRIGQTRLSLMLGRSSVCVIYVTLKDMWPQMIWQYCFQKSWIDIFFSSFLHHYYQHWIQMSQRVNFPNQQCCGFIDMASEAMRHRYVPSACRNFFAVSLSLSILRHMSSRTLYRQRV